MSAYSSLLRLIYGTYSINYIQVHTFPMDESLTSVKTWKASSGSTPGTNDSRYFITNLLCVPILNQGCFKYLSKDFFTNMFLLLFILNTHIFIEKNRN